MALYLLHKLRLLPPREVTFYWTHYKYSAKLFWPLVGNVCNIYFTTNRSSVNLRNISKWCRKPEQSTPSHHAHPILTALNMFPSSSQSTSEGLIINNVVFLALFIRLTAPLYPSILNSDLVLSFFCLQPALVTRFDLAYPGVTTENYMASFI